MSDAELVRFEETLLGLDLGSLKSWWRTGSDGRRSRVWLVELQRGVVVVKEVIGEPDAGERFAREVVALELAARVEPPVVPKLLVTDPAERVLVLEYAGGSFPSTEWPVDYAVALARLHSATGPDDAGALPVWSYPTRHDVEAFLAFAGALGADASGGAAVELADLVERFAHMPGHALLHGDPCPGNDLYTTAGIRFVDFEQAALGNGIVELAYLRIGFPTCAFAPTFALSLLEKAENAYRTTWQAETGTDLVGDVADACVGWLIRGDTLVAKAERDSLDHLGRAVEQDWEWGSATARERLAHRLGVVAALTIDHRQLGSVGLLCVDLRRRMLELWPDLRSLLSLRPYVTWV